MVGLYKGNIFGGKSKNFKFLKLRFLRDKTIFSSTFVPTIWYFYVLSIYRTLSIRGDVQGAAVLPIQNKPKSFFFPSICKISSL